MAVVALESITLFRYLGRDELQALRFIAQERHFAAHAEIFHEDDPGNGVYFVKDGLVEISSLVGNSERHVFSQLGPGEIFGEMAMIERRPRSATATAVKDTDVYFLPRGEMLSFIERSPALAFGLDDFAEVNPVEFAEAVADLLQQAERQGGRAFDEREHFPARQEINVRVFDRDGGGRARAMFDYGHFAENFPGTKLGKDMPVAVADEAGNFHQPVLDKIDAIAGIVFMENLGLGGEMPFLGDKAQRLQFIAAQIAKQSNGFKRDHDDTL